MVNIATQESPYPHLLKFLVENLKYKKGWDFYLVDHYDRGQGSKGLTLQISIATPDSYHPEKMIRVNHLFPVIPAAYDRRSWQRWLFDQILLVERHEACEFFSILDDKPYAPSHGPGNDPYLVRELGTNEDQRTSFRGEING
jgi:hypothetical protein